MDCFCHCMQPHAGCGLANRFPVFEIFNFSVISPTQAATAGAQTVPEVCMMLVGFCFLDSWVESLSACTSRNRFQNASDGFRVFQGLCVRDNALIFAGANVSKIPRLVSELQGLHGTIAKLSSRRGNERDIGVSYQPSVASLKTTVQAVNI